jgi:hypothetical protein
MELLLVSLVSSFGTLGLVAILLIFFWDKVELFISRVLKVLSGFNTIFRKLRKKSVQLNVQSRVNIAVKKLSRHFIDLETDKIKIEWIDKNQTRKSFLDNGNSIIRLRKDDTNEHNFIHGTYLYVSSSLLFKVKNHLNKSQKETMDLYVTSELIQNEKNSAIDFFMEHYLRPSIENNQHRRKYFQKYQKIDKHGYYYPILINELNFLGKKVFASVGKLQLTKEFDQIISFLEKASDRRIGDDFSNLEFAGQFTKVLIIIIGKPDKINDEERYIKFIHDKSKKQKINSIYAVGDLKNKKIIKNICNRVKDEFNIVKTGEGTALLNRRYGGTKMIQQYFIILRKNQNKMIQ